MIVTKFSVPAPGEMNYTGSAVGTTPVAFGFGQLAPLHLPAARFRTMF
jgi:hypothetical protein